MIDCFIQCMVKNIILRVDDSLHERWKKEKGKQSWENFIISKVNSMNESKRVLIPHFEHPDYAKNVSIQQAIYKLTRIKRPSEEWELRVNMLDVHFDENEIEYILRKVDENKAEFAKAQKEGK